MARNVSSCDTLDTSSDKVNPLYQKIRHVYIDKNLSHQKLADLLLEKRNIQVSTAFISLLLRGKRIGAKSFGKQVLAAIVEELGIEAGEIKPEAERGDQP